MTEIEKKIIAAEKKISKMMKTAKWQQSVQKSDKQVSETLTKLRQRSKVDPKLLDEPATL